MLDATPLPEKNHRLRSKVKYMPASDKLMKEKTRTHVDKYIPPSVMAKGPRQRVMGLIWFISAALIITAGIIGYVEFDKYVKPYIEELMRKPIWPRLIHTGAGILSTLSIYD